MRALHLTSHEIPPILSDLPKPNPGPGQIGLRIAACGLNFADLLMMQGRYQDTPPLPFTLGLEVSGTVEHVGDGVTGFAPGDRVAVFGGRDHENHRPVDVAS